MSVRTMFRTSLAFVLSVWLVPAGAGPSHAAFPGNNGKIAFASNLDGDYEIYTVNADGSNLTQLTFNTSSDRHPSWSPDGRWLVFESDRSGTNGEIFSMRANGTQVRRLTNSPGQDVDPAWSGNGQMIVFASDRGGTGDYDIFTMRANGRDERRITRNTDEDLDPAWSPNGAQIAFESNRGSGADHIFRMRPDGSRARRVTPPGIFASYDPSFAPNGRWLVFSMDDGSPSGGYELWKSRLDGSGLVPLTGTSGVHDAEPAWSPDGTKIVYYDDLDGDRELVIRNADGSSATQITFNTADDREPDWQPT